MTGSMFLIQTDEQLVEMNEQYVGSLYGFISDVGPHKVRRSE